MTGSVEREDMADEHDRASALERLEIEQRLRFAKRNVIRDQEPNDDGSYGVVDCVKCGSEIGEARLKVAIKNLWCIYCAVQAEKRL